MALNSNDLLFAQDALGNVTLTVSRESRNFGKVTENLSVTNA